MEHNELVINYINRCKNKYGSLFDYLTININEVKQVSHTKVPIKCQYHGIFYQNLYSHLYSVCPCPSCRKMSKQDKDGNRIITSIKDDFVEGVIYLYINKRNGKKYVGQTINEKRRKIEHLRVNQRNKILFDKILQKEGSECFEYKVLERIREKRSKITSILNNREKYYIREHNSQVPNGYNVLPGGNTIRLMKGYRPTKKTLQKLRDSHKGIPNKMKGKHLCENDRKVRVAKWRKTMNNKYANGYIAQRKSIIVYRKISNNYIYDKIYPNAKEIERQYGISNKKVHYALEKSRPLDDEFIFIYKDKFDENNNIIEKIKNEKSIITFKEKFVNRLNKYGDKLDTISLKEATKIYGRHVSECCDGKRVKTKGYKFVWATKLDGRD